MRVLYIHPFKSYGDATKSLIEILKKFPAHKIQSVVITPKGEASKAFRQVGARVLNVNGISQWDDTNSTYYKGFRWLILLRELFYLPGSILALIRVKSYGPFSLLWMSFERWRMYSFITVLTVLSLVFNTIALDSITLVVLSYLVVLLASLFVFKKRQLLEGYVYFMKKLLKKTLKKSSNK